jgi:dihydroneopterin triphosphate diphosphatase
MEIISSMIEAHIFRRKNSEIEFLLLRRAENVIYPGLWQPVNGKIEEGEKAFETALREIREETGCIPLKVWAAPHVNSFYSHEKNIISLLPVFAAEFNCKDEIKISKEHSDFKWVSPEQAVKQLAWVGQRKSVEVITQYVTKEDLYFSFVEIKF